MRQLFAALLSASFAAQLLLAGVGAACVMPASGGARGQTSDERAMAAMGMVEKAADAPGQQEPDSRRSPDGGRPCEQSLPTTSCQQMAPCTVTAIAPAFAPGAERVSAPQAVAFAPSSFASRTTAPELPPPRA